MRGFTAPIGRNNNVCLRTESSISRYNVSQSFIKCSYNFVPMIQLRRPGIRFGGYSCN